MHLMIAAKPGIIYSARKASESFSSELQVHFQAHMSVVLHLKLKDDFILLQCFYSKAKRNKSFILTQN